MADLTREQIEAWRNADCVEEPDWNAVFDLALRALDMEAEEKRRDECPAAWCPTCMAVFFSDDVACPKCGDEGASVVSDLADAVDRIFTTARATECYDIDEGVNAVQRLLDDQLRLETEAMMVDMVLCESGATDPGFEVADRTEKRLRSLAADAKLGAAVRAWRCPECGSGPGHAEPYVVCVKHLAVLIAKTLREEADRG